jgi:hypothetical protein
MSEFRMIAIASELAEKVRETRLSPGYGHPVTAKVATAWALPALSAAVCGGAGCADAVYAGSVL